MEKNSRMITEKLYDKIFYTVVSTTNRDLEIKSLKFFAKTKDGTPIVYAWMGGRPTGRDSDTERLLVERHREGKDLCDEDEIKLTVRFNDKFGDKHEFIVIGKFDKKSFHELKSACQEAVCIELNRPSNALMWAYV
jgi:hypothetical protein